MAIIVKTHNPISLISRIRQMIDNQLIDTWNYDDDGDFTHTGQWKNKAWLSPLVEEDKVTFYIIGRKSVQMTLMEYSIFHGRFAELLLNYFCKDFHSLTITSPLEFPEDSHNIDI